MSKFAFAFLFLICYWIKVVHIFISLLSKKRENKRPEHSSVVETKVLQPYPGDEERKQINLHWSLSEKGRLDQMHYSCFRGENGPQSSTERRVFKSKGNDWLRAGEQPGRKYCQRVFCILTNGHFDWLLACNRSLSRRCEGGNVQSGRRVFQHPAFSEAARPETGLSRGKRNIPENLRHIPHVHEFSNTCFTGVLSLFKDTLLFYFCCFA